MYGKEWVFIKFVGGEEWVPSFEDIFRINQAIAICEDKKYPDGEGRRMLQKFLAATCNPYLEWWELKEMFLIPGRNRDEIRASSKEGRSKRG